MKRLALITSVVLLAVMSPTQSPPKANAAVGQWSQANGAVNPNFDEFNRSDDTNATVCATTYSGTPYVCWSEYRSSNYKLLVTMFDGTNWAAPSTILGSIPGIDVLRDSSVYNEDTFKYDNPSMTIVRYDSGTETIDVPIIFSTKVSSYMSSNQICCAYLLGTTWTFQYFTNSNHTVDEPQVIVGDDGRIYATWCQQKVSDNLPVIIYADPVFPLVWKDIYDNPVSSTPDPLLSLSGIYTQARIDTFNSKPTVCCTYKPSSTSKSDISFIRWDGANWGGLVNLSPTIFGEANLNESNPKMVLNSYGSPVVVWDTDENTSKTYFAMWNGTQWVNTDGPGKLDLSQKFVGGVRTSDPDLIKGQYGIYHVALNYDTSDAILYLQTNLTQWYAVEQKEGKSTLPFGISRPSLAVQHDNFPMIAGDRMLPSDNPAFTEYQYVGQFFVEWGIDTNQQGTTPDYQDDGKIITNSNDQIFPLRAIINYPHGTGLVKTTFIYTIPPQCSFIPDLNLNFIGQSSERWGQRVDGRWDNIGLFSQARITDYQKIKIIFFSNKKSITLRFSIEFDGFNYPSRWLKNLADVTIENKSITIPMMIMPNIIDTTSLYTGTSIVTNPITQYQSPTFYIDADHYSDTLTTDGKKIATFIIYIYPVGPFDSPVSLFTQSDPKANLSCNPNPSPVPQGFGVRRAFLTIEANANTPPGTFKVKVIGSALSGSVPDESWVDLELYVIGAKLAITKRADQVSVQPGSVISYTITVQNIGGADAEGVYLEDSLSADLVYVSSYPQAILEGKKAVWNIGTITPGQKLYFTLKAKVAEKMFGEGSIIVNVANAFYNGWQTSAATVYISVRPAEIPCPNPQAEIKFTTEGDTPKAGVPIYGKLYVWDGCNPYNFQLFWGDETGELKGYMDGEGSYTLPPHTYETAGTYMISCFVTDKYGKQNIIRKHIVIH